MLANKPRQGGDCIKKKILYRLYCRYMKKYLKLYSPFVALSMMMFVSIVNVDNVEAAGCKFDRDLDSGVSDGDDILCLQKYLNQNGFLISSSGAGSKGKETNQFKTLTKEAVIKWQKDNKLSPSSGIFGPKSRAKYEELMSGTAVKTPASVPTLSNGAVDVSPEALALRITELKNQLSSTITTPVKPPSVSTATLTSVQKHLRLVAQSLQNSETKVDANTGATDYKRALSSLTDARADFLSAVIYFIDGNTSQVETLLTSVELDISYALKYIGATDTSTVSAPVVSSGATEANKKLDTVTASYNSARTKLSSALDDDKDVSESSDLLKQAKTLLTKSKTYITNENYKSSLDYTTDADDLIIKAVRALSTKTVSLSDYYTNTRTSYKSVLADMKQTASDGDDIGDAKKMLSDANSYLSDASDYIDSRDESSARRLIDKAVTKIKSAKNEF